jgi:hypothetical protein
MMEGGHKSEISPNSVTGGYPVQYITEVTGAGAVPIYAEITMPGGGEGQRDTTKELATPDTSSAEGLVHSAETTSYAVTPEAAILRAFTRARESSRQQAVIDPSDVQARERAERTGKLAMSRLLGQIEVGTELGTVGVDLGEHTDEVVEMLTTHLLDVCDAAPVRGVPVTYPRSRVGAALQAVYPHDTAEVSLTERVIAASHARVVEQGPAHNRRAVADVLSRKLGMPYEAAVQALFNMQRPEPGQ